MNMMRDRAALEVSLPKYKTGSNVHCLPLDQALAAARSVVEEFGPRVPWGAGGTPPTFLDLTLARIDLVVDFPGVDDIPRLLDSVDLGSRDLDIPTTRIACDGESLLRHRKRWSCTLYDKYLETRRAASIDRATRGHLRCEARLRADRLNSRWASNCGQRGARLDGLSIESINAMMTGTFVAAGFARTLVADDIFDAIVAASNLTPMEKVKVSGFHRHPSLYREVAPATAKLFRRLSNELAAGTPVARRLDVGIGELVAA